MTKPRSHYVDSELTLCYHITSRCVRRAWLLGIDPLTGKNYQHRQKVFLDHLKHLTRFYSVDILGYAIMSNHFHLVVRYDPRANLAWSDEEVARRWCAAHNGLPVDQSFRGATEVGEFSFSQTLRYHEMLIDQTRLAKCRGALGCLSKFMQQLKQPFAVWANHEDEAKGHFFESRFYSGALLERSDLLTCMSYVDLNPIEAGIAISLSEAKHTSVHERLTDARISKSDLDQYLAPLWKECPPTPDDPPCTLQHYVSQLNLGITQLRFPEFDLTDKMDSWMVKLVNRHRKKEPSKHPAYFDYR